VSDTKEYFWRGPIRSAEHAVRTIDGVAITFMIFGGLALAPILNAATTRERFATLILASLIGLPAGFLYKYKNLASARTLMGVIGFFTAIPLVVGVIMFVSRPDSGILVAAFPLLICGLLLFATTRAAAAAYWLKEARRRASRQADAFG